MIGTGRGTNGRPSHTLAHADDGPEPHGIQEVEGSTPFGSTLPSFAYVGGGAPDSMSWCPRHAGDGIKLGRSWASGTVIRYDARFRPGGFQVPSPAGRIEGGVSFGQ